MRIGRNDPCPCGSGKKYKKCCLPREEASARPPRQAPALALEWLARHHKDLLAEAFAEGFAKSLDEEEREEIHRLPDALFEQFQVNFGEWLLAEATVRIGRKKRRLLDLVLAEDGPALAPEERELLRSLGARPLWLYEVAGLRPGEGLLLRDALSPDAAPVFVRDRAASRSAREGDVLGVRVLPTDPPTLSGAAYGFPATDIIPLRRAILGEGRRRKKPDPERVGEAIRELWLSRLVGPPPTIVDASGEEILLVTTHYRVRDRKKVKSVLDAQPDVAGSGDEWSRLDDPDAEPARTLCSIRLAGPRRLELFARTRTSSEQSQAWLEGLLGDAIERTVSEVVDPRSVWRQRGRAERAAPADEDPLSGLPPEERTRLYQKVHEKIYANWTDEPIPILGGKTPREAIRSAAGRRDVVDLLRGYERDERDRAESEGRRPVDFGFLWKRLGLDPDEHRR